MDRKVYDVLSDNVVETMYHIVSMPTLGLFICRDDVVIVSTRTMAMCQEYPCCGDTLIF